MKPIRKEKEVSEYSTHGRNEFRNAHTGEIQKSVTIDWSPTGAMPMAQYSLDDEYKEIIKSLPDIIHLSGFKDTYYDYEEDLCVDNLGREELYNVSHGTLMKIYKYVNGRN